MGGEVAAVEAAHAVANEMDGTTGVDFRDFCLEDLCAVDGAACCWHAGDEDLGAVFLEDFFDAAPVGYLEGCDGGANCDGIEAEKTVTEDDGMLGGAIWRVSAEKREEKTDGHFLGG